MRGAKLEAAEVLRPLKLSFSWAVPSEAALQAITEVAKAPGLVEVGAGTGSSGLRRH